MLDLGTGTGVLPRNMHSFGAKWTGADISPEQIEQAKKLSQGMGIGYYAMPFEDKIAGMSEDPVLRYSPDWSGAGETMHPIEIPACYKKNSSSCITRSGS